MPDDSIAELDKIEADARANFDKYTSHADNLVGSIDKELAVKHSDELANIVVQLASKLDEQLGHFQDVRTNILEQNVLLAPTFKDNWINYQKKHDYNPPHRHSGVIVITAHRTIRHKR